MKTNQKTLGSTLLGALAMMGIGIFMVFRTIFKIVKTIAFGAETAMDMLLPMRNKTMPVFKTDPLCISANVPLSKDFEQTVIAGATPRQTGEFLTADRIVSIRLDPAVAVLNLRIFYAKQLVKREMIVNEPRLRALMQGRRHTLPDVAYNPEVGLDQLKEDTVELAEKMINQLGNAKAKTGRRSETRESSTVVERKAAPQVAQKVKPQIEVKPTVTPAPTPKVSAQPPVAQIPIEVAPAQPRKAYAPPPATGVTFTGVLSEAGIKKHTPEGREAYETYQAKVMLSNGTEVPLRGIELERELSANKVELGDRVSITPMGRVPVNLAGGKEGFKNVYRVERLRN